MKASIVLVVVFLGAALLLGSQAQGPNIEGSYELVKRVLPDGTELRPPQVMGMITFTRDKRNFNVYWTDDKDNRFSIGAISEYTITNEKYTEKNLYYMENASIVSEGVTYDLYKSEESSPVTKQRGEIRFDLPLHDEPSVVFTSKGFTATQEGEYVDHWKLIK